MREMIAIVTSSEDISLTTAIEQVAEAIMITDREGAIQYVNPAFERITDYSGDEAVGREWRIVASDRHEKAFYDEMYRVLKPGGRLIITAPCMSEPLDQYISLNHYGLLDPAEEGYTFWQRDLTVPPNATS